MERRPTRPGPIGKSCLTCRKRRKKCDQIRPTCERCLKGKFECLGYDRLADSEKNPETPNFEHSCYLDTRNDQDVWEILDGGKSSTNVSAAAIGPGSTLLDLDSLDNPGDILPTTHSLARIEYLTSQRPVFPNQVGSEISHGPLTSRTNEAQLHDFPDSPLDQPEPLYHLSSRTLSLLLSIPMGLSWVSADITDLANFFMARFQKLVRASFFKPAYRQVVQIHNAVKWRLQYFPSSRWAMFVCMKLFDLTLEGNQFTEQQYTEFRHWMKQIERVFYLPPAQNLNSVETQNRLKGSLEFALFRLRADSLNTYELLRSCAPTFLQIVFSDPTLWPSSNTSTSVSLAHVISSDSYEIAHFAMLDMMCSMAYALPQIIDYDTSTTAYESATQPVELVHGCPPELQTILVDINARCSWKQIGPVLDWHSVERRLRDWQPTVHPAVAGEESWRLVARLVVQETWRHTLLIYLYMAVCGAASNEIQVELSVRQVFQALNTIKHELEPVANAHFFMQYLIAGAFTPNEKYRALSRAKLLDGLSTRFWLLDISCFVPILDHLWHGAAANGRPVRWSDYAYSRQAIMPITV